MHSQTRFSFPLKREAWPCQFGPLAHCKLISFFSFSLLFLSFLFLSIRQTSCAVHILTDLQYRPVGWPHCWCLACPDHWVALGLLDRPDPGRHQHRRHCHLQLRVKPPCPHPAQGEATLQGAWARRSAQLLREPGQACAVDKAGLAARSRAADQNACPISHPPRYLHLCRVRLWSALPPLQYHSYSLPGRVSLEHWHHRPRVYPHGSRVRFSTLEASLLLSFLLALTVIL